MPPAAGATTGPSRPRGGGRRRGAVTVVAAVVMFLAAGAIGLGALGLALGPASPPSPPRSAPVAAGALAEDARFTVWERNDDGTPVRWDPCTPIEIVFSPAAAPASARSDLVAALDRVADASGLTLRLVGRTDERPSGDRPPYQPERYGQRWAPILIAWSDPGAGGTPLRDTDRGVAVPVAVGPPGDRTYVTGQVVLNAHRDDLRPGFDDRADAWGATLVHELLHVLGLGHVDDPTELMYVHPGDGPVSFGTGDLAGLAAVGAAQGCRAVPTAGPVTVADPPDGPRHGVP